MKLFGLSLFGCKSSSNVIDQGIAISGPFEITWDVTSTRSGAWYNNGGDPNAKQFTSFFNIKYKGNPVKISPDANSQDDFWQAFFLKDAPQPALLAGQHSMYLVTEENGSPKVTPLHEQDGDFATYQWLDSEDGQPGEMRRVFLGDDSSSSRDLTGGRYLVINSVVVLDVQTLDAYRFELNGYELLQTLDGYNAGGEMVAQFSPGKTQMVFVGGRPNPENRLLHQYALVACDFKKNTAYAIPFDRTEKRFFSIWDATPEWLNTYFEWTVNDAGEERIQPKVLAQLPYWQGRWSHSEFTGEATDYKLEPVETTMLEPVLEFVRQHKSVSGESREEIESHQGGYENPTVVTLVTVTMQIGPDKLYVYSNPVEQRVSLGSNNIALVQELGKLFDEEMKRGKYQEFFGKYE